MGKALIVSGGGGGQYTVQPIHDRTRIAAETAQLQQIILDLEDSIAEAVEELETKSAEMDDLYFQLRPKIDELTAWLESIPVQQQALSMDITEVRGVLG